MIGRSTHAFCCLLLLGHDCLALSKPTTRRQHLSRLCNRFSANNEVTLVHGPHINCFSRSQSWLGLCLTFWVLRSPPLPSPFWHWFFEWLPCIWPGDPHFMMTISASLHLLVISLPWERDSNSRLPKVFASGYCTTILICTVTASSLLQLWSVGNQQLLADIETQGHFSTI